MSRVLDRVSKLTNRKVGRVERARRAMLSIAAACVTLLTVVLGGGPATASLAPSMCDFAIVLGVRGTGAPAGTGLTHGDRVWKSGGFGDQLSPLRTSLIGVNDMPFYFLSLNYPAKAVPYSTSVDAGRSTLIKELNYLATACPGAPIVLIGHSQGAQVISSVLTGPGVGSGGIFGVSTAALNQIAAVTLYGDPTYEPNKVTNYLNPPKYGLLMSTVYPKSDLANHRYWGYPMGGSGAGWVYKVREYCKTGDFFCQSNVGDSSYAIHNSYAGYASNARDFIVYMNSGMSF